MYRPVAPPQTLECFHCGTVCGKDLRFYEEKSFCCLGCESVYKFLHAEQLDAYYNLTEHPGISPAQDLQGKFDYLLEPALADSLFDFKGPKLGNITFSIPQMHCVSCVWLLEKLYALHPAIRHSRVQFSLRQLTVTFDHTVLSIKELVQLLSVIGYEPEINLAAKEDIARGEANRHDKKLYYQIGIAGFCFGNVMLISLPEYFDWDQTMGEHFKQWFGYINLLLSFPVLLYSAKDYFKSAWAAIKGKTLNLDVPLVAGMIALFGTSAYQILTQTGAGYMDSFTGLLFFLLLGKAFQQKTYKHLSFERDFKSYLPLSARVLQGDRITSVPLDALSTGSRILVKHGEIIPADSILLKGVAWIDYSFVTGEATPVEKTLGELVHAGGKHQGTAIELEVVKETEASYFTSLWNYGIDGKREEVLDTIANKAGRRFSYFLFTVAVVSFLFWLPNLEQAVMVFASVLIVACPCALALSAPFTFGNTIRILGRNGFYLKNTGVIEKLAKADTLVFDKTGTLTETQAPTIRYTGDRLQEEEVALFAALFGQSVHPLSKSLASHLGGVYRVVNDFKEHPGLGIEGEIGGVHLKAGSLRFITGQQEEKLLLYTRVYLAMEGKVIGYFELSSKFREGVDQFPSTLSEYQFAVCSGDQPRDKAALEAILPASTIYRFGQLPEQKRAFIESLQQEGKQIAMIGDGLNDASALKSSNVGIAVSEQAGHFSPACDSILNASRFHSLPQYLRFTRISVRIVYACFAISAAYNLTGLSIAVQGHLSPVVAAILMPLSSITIVLFTTISTNLVARRLKLN
jgi:Cu+-exporting ATPase